MDDTALYEATVPVFSHYNARIAAIVRRLDETQQPFLTDRLSEGTFPAGQHLAIAQGYVLRTVYPLIDRPIPDFSTEETDANGLLQRVGELSERLGEITRDRFAGAMDRRVAHEAGKARHEQNATEFVTLYAVPNFFFHLTMGYATLRGRGVELGKADFDGYHLYPAGFRFA